MRTFQLASLLLFGPTALLPLGAQDLTAIDITPGFAANAFQGAPLDALRGQPRAWLQYGWSYPGTPGIFQLCSDGTPVGTQPVALLGATETNPRLGIELPNGRLLTYQRDFGVPLTWRYVIGDGTAAVTEFLGNLEQSLPVQQALTRVLDEVWFVARRDGGPYGLWRSDGTAAGTSSLPNPLAGTGATLHGISAVGDRIFLFSDLGSNPTLWVTDRQLTPAIKLQQFPVGNPAELTSAPLTVSVSSFQGGLVFGLGNAGPSSGLWFSDGSSQGTRLVGARLPAKTSYAFAQEGDQTWALAAHGVSSGPGDQIVHFAPGAPVQVLDLGAAGVEASHVTAMALAGRFFFAGTTPASGTELWSSDGSLAGTQMLVDLGPRGSSGVQVSQATPFLRFGQRFVFAGRGAAGGWSLFASNGTVAGTQPVVSSLQPAEGLASRGYAQAGEKLVVVTGQTGPEDLAVWALDINQGGEQLLYRPQILWAEASAAPRELTRCFDQVLMNAQAGAKDPEVYASQGTQATTLAITAAPAVSSTTTLAPGLNPQRDFTILGNACYFAGFLDPADFRSARLMAYTAGRPAAEAVLAKQVQNMLRFKDQLAFVASDLNAASAQQPAPPLEGLYLSNGTAAGTTALLEYPQIAPPGPANFAISEQSLTVFGDGLLFSAYSGANGAELWGSDGTPTGTALIKALQPGGSTFAPPSIVVAGQRAYFRVLQIAELQTDLWVTDGTAAGTQQAVDLKPGVPDRIGRLAALGNRLVFAAAGDGSEEDLWITDGTQAGTQLLVDLDTSGKQVNLLVTGERLWFTRGVTPEPGSPYGNLELWTSDGTPAGTLRLKVQKSTYGGPFQMIPVKLIDAGFHERIFFAASDEAGTELWVSDGTSAGTRRCFDLNPGPGSSIFQATELELVRRGGELFVRFYRDNIGEELGVLPASVAGGWAQAQLGESCGSPQTRPAIRAAGDATLGGQFQVELSNLSPAQPVLLLASAAMALPLGPGVCALQLEAPRLLERRLSDGLGQVEFALRLPNQPTLIDQPLYFQALAASPSGGYLGRFDVSQVLEVVAAE
jgi:ELWxxDGT repeat protein